jgi:hypothetical protein
MPRSQKDCTPEGGKFQLAKALFDTFKYKIRCARCAGNPTRQGFTPDNAGKGTKDGLTRRMWACQRSNGRKETNRCGRVTCTEYIELARAQLSHAQFTSVLGRVCQRFPPEQEEYAALQGYRELTAAREGAPLNGPPQPIPTPATPAARPPPTRSAPTLPAKRKADEDLPFRDKATWHPQAQQRRETSSSGTSILSGAVPHLEALVKIGEACQKELELLSIFLASSSPPQPPPSCSTPSWSSPSLALPSVFSDPVVGHGFPSDATIPCTYPDGSPPSSPPKSSTDPPSGELGSAISEPPPSSPVTVYVSGVSVGTLPPTSTPADPPPSTPAPGSRPYLSSASRAKELVQQFNDARADPATATAKRRTIRDQARADGVYALFQRLLAQKHPFFELQRSGRS